MMRWRLLSLGFAVLLAAAPAASETLELPGLSAPATVSTDDLGIAHIQAQTLEDAVRAQGWVTARDRFFQMDYTRRRVEGTAAELTSSILDLVSDQFFRPLDLRSTCERSIELLTEEESRLLHAYAEGVNAWLATHELPGEYTDLEITEVRPWSPIDSLLAARFLGVFLDLVQTGPEIAGFTGRLAAWIEAGANAEPPFDGALMVNEDLARFEPMDHAATVPDAGGSLPTVPAGLGRASVTGAAGATPRIPATVAALARRFHERIADLPGLGSRVIGAGSNAWGVSAAHSATGTPLVASDGHVTHSAPNTGYEIHLRVADDPAGSLSLSGLSIPGSILIFEGQTEKIAWAGTDAPWDQADLFADRLVRGEPGCAARLCIDSAGELHPVEESDEVYRRNQLDGQPDNPVEATTIRTLRVPFRSHGPILEIEDSSVADPGEDPAETTVLTLQFSGLHGDRLFGGVLAWARASDVDDFREGAKLFDVPSTNWVVADTSGSLAYFGAGEVPLRADLEAGTFLGSLEVVRDGSGPANWVPDPSRSQGQQIPFAVLPFDEMPQVVNPPEGFVASANGDPLGLLNDNQFQNSFRAAKPTAIYYISSYFGFGLRPGRITQLLRDKIAAVEPMTIDHMKAFQGNTQMLDAELMLPFLQEAWSAAQGAGAPAELTAFAADPELLQAMARFASWDYSSPSGIPEGYDASETDGVLEPVTAAEAEASIAATIYSVWRGEAVDRTVVAIPRAFDPSLPTWNGLVGVTALHHHLSEDPFTGVGAAGFDFFPDPPGLTPEQRRDVTLLEALRGALDALASPAFADAFAGSTDQDDYRWGRLNRVSFPFLVEGVPALQDRSIPPTGGFSDLGPNLPGIPKDSADETVNTTGYDGLASSDDSFEHDFGASWRLVMSPGHPDAAPDAVLGFRGGPGGPSGDADDPSYVSKLLQWLTVDHHPVLVGEDDLAPLPSEDAVAVAATKSQRACIQEATKRGVGVGKAQDKEASFCVKLAAKGKEADPEGCLTADTKGKIAKARAKAAAGEEKRCGERPLFAFAGEGVSSDAGAAASLALVEDLFGTDLNPVLVTKGGDKAGAACQGELLKGAQKALETIWKEAGKAEKAALAGKKGATPAESGYEVQQALAAVFAPSAKVGKALAKLERGGAKKCGAVADLAALAPGRCTGADAASVTGCLGERALCRACRSLNAMDALALPCDTLDDGEVDASC